LLIDMKLGGMLRFLEGCIAIFFPVIFPVIFLVLMSCGFAGGVSVFEETNMKASSSGFEKSVGCVIDSVVTKSSAWISSQKEGGHWLQLDIEKTNNISEVHLFTGVRSLPGSVIGSGEIQIKEGEGWKKVAEFSNNRKEDFKVVLPKPVEVTSIRLWTAQKGQVAVREMAVYGEPTPLGTGLTFHSLGAHQVGVNQLAYNDGAPKRFTVPTATKDGVKFSIREAEGGKPLFSGEVKDGIGDFSKWQAGTEAGSKGGNYLIHVEGGGLEPNRPQKNLISNSRRLLKTSKENSSRRTHTERISEP